MNNDSLKINPSAEKYKITSFIKTVLKREGFKNVVIGMSAGLDSTTAFYLLKEVVPPQNIIIAHLYYLDSQFRDIGDIIRKAGVPKNNIYKMSISPLVEMFQKILLSFRHSGNQAKPGYPESPTATRDAGQASMTDIQQIRLGNIMARIRMIILYDLAKKHNALVAGTENKSEFLLGYFTRFGDEASDFEPIQHLYKTQVYQLANFLGVPENIIKKTPTAGLWQSQTDEKEFGFTYKEADEVLFYYYDKKLKPEEIRKKGFANADEVIAFSLKNSYKHRAPYAINNDLRLMI